MPLFATTRHSRHPGLHLLFEKLLSGGSATEEEYRLLQSHIGEMNNKEEEWGNSKISAATIMTSDLAMLPGYATVQGGHRFATRHRDTARFFRQAQDTLVSSVGVGTYRGAADFETSDAYVGAIRSALQGGINLIDSSLNYRNQLSERAVGTAIRNFLELGGGNRDEFVVCSKGGFLVPGAVSPGVITADDVAGGTHCLSPAFLADQLERSRRNMGLETIDVYYLHNPEVQLRFADGLTFQKRLESAFEFLERSVADGLIRYYGTATWDGYLSGALSLPQLVEIARRVGGDTHHFRFIQLPFSMSMREATNIPIGSEASLIDVAIGFGLTVIASACLWQGRLSHGLPPDFRRLFGGLMTDAQFAIQFTRSTLGITSALVGMSNSAHVQENLAVAGVPPLTRIEYQTLISRL
jgi:aryl-alcohol dehydrogenase-like predicted oxidoreductase